MPHWQTLELSDLSYQADKIIKVALLLYKLWSLVVQDNNFTKNQKFWILDTTQEEVLFRASLLMWFDWSRDLWPN